MKKISTRLIYSVLCLGFKKRVTSHMNFRKLIFTTSRKDGLG